MFPWFHFNLLSYTVINSLTSSSSVSWGELSNSYKICNTSFLCIMLAGVSCSKSIIISGGRSDTTHNQSIVSK